MHEHSPDWCDYPRQQKGCITVDHKRCIGCSACTTFVDDGHRNTESKNPRNVCYAVNAQTPDLTGALKLSAWKDITV